MADISSIFYIDSTGVHVPDLQTVLNFLTDGYKNIYGKDVVLTPDTQDGQWIALQAQALYDTMCAVGTVYRSFSPSTALRDALDMNVRINGIRRQTPTYSMCDVTLIGSAGTRIINGSVKDVNNNVWNLPAEIIIPVNGEITVTATAANAGSINALPHTITVINTPTRGWQSVDNDNESTAGRAVESDAELRTRQGISVSLPAQTIFESMIGAVANVTGVTRYKGYENDTNETDINGIPAHSSCLVVEGGDAEEIANQIVEHKTVGSGTYGDTTINVRDRYGVLTAIKFQRPTYNHIKMQVNLKPLQGYSATYATEMKTRLAAYINGLQIGDTVYNSRLYPPALSCNGANTDTFIITSILTSKDDGGFSTADINIAFNAVATMTDADVEVITEGN